jgi:hypothetical protein
MHADAHPRIFGNVVTPHRQGEPLAVNRQESSRRKFT